MRKALIDKLRRQGANRERRKIKALIREWRGHYPTAIFPDPAVGKHGKTVDACSARAVRSVLRGILKDLNDRDGL